MKSKLRYLLLIFPLALFIWAYQATSWRPKLIGTQPTPPANGLIPRRLMRWKQLLISPDGKWLASGGEDGKAIFVMLWDVPARRQTWRTKPVLNVDVNALTFSPDSRILAIRTDGGLGGQPDSALSLVETATGKERPLLKFPSKETLQDAAFLSNRELIVSTPEGALMADTRTGKTIRRWKFLKPTLQDTKLPPPAQSQISADGTAIIALTNATSDTAVAIYDSATGKQRGTWTYPKVFRSPRLSPNGKLWAMQPQPQDADGYIEVHDAQTGKLTWGPFSTNFYGYGWAWSADSTRLMLGVGSIALEIHDARTGRHLENKSVSGYVRTLVAQPDDNYIYTLDVGGKIIRWRLR